MIPVFSILGDSISTFSGISIPEHMVFYDAYTQRQAGLHAAGDTWWMRVITAHKDRLGVNCSGAGTLVCGLGPAAGCSEQRTGLLGQNGAPDWVLVAMGANDWAYGVPLGELDTLDARTFFGAYQLMLRRLKAAYPAARVVCATLLRGQDPADGPLFFNAEAAGPMEPYNEVIRATCGLEGCQVADLAATCPAYATLDGVHPNAAGMGQLAAGWLAYL